MRNKQTKFIRFDGKGEIAIPNNINAKSVVPFNQVSSFIEGVGRLSARQNLTNSKFLLGNSGFLLQNTKNFGFTPQLHEESELKRRIIRHGYGHMLDTFRLIKQDEFYDSVNRCMSLRNSQKVNKPSIHKLHNALKRASRLANLPRYKFRTCSTNFALTTLKNSASAGYGYVGKKGMNLDEIKLNTDLLFNENTPNGINEFIHNCPQVLSFRIQSRLETDSVKSKTKKVNQKIRPIFMYPAHITAAETRFGFPFLNHFMNLGKNSFYASGFNGEGIGDLLKTRLKNGKYRHISLDVSAWDQSLPNWLIYAAFALLRSHLQLSKQESLVFQNLAVYFTTSIVSTKIGKDHILQTTSSGMSSGSLFTNMIGTLCHLILLCLVDDEVADSEAFILCSDDNIFSTKRDLNYYISAYKQIAGLTIAKQKSDIFSDRSFVKFLGYTWVNYKRNISVTLCLNQIVYHSSFRTDLSEYERHVARSASILLNGFNGIPVFKQLFPEIIDALNKGVDVRFTYMHSFMNPNEILDREKSLDRNESLRLHLERGPCIR
jgi:hypothetical protein